jgi:hypothetical protein
MFGITIATPIKDITPKELAIRKVRNSGDNLSSSTEGIPLFEL